MQSTEQSVQPLPTFAEAEPACLAEWDYKRNEEEGFHPHKITLGSRKLVHWICPCCPIEQPHCRRAMPNNRIYMDSGCAVCSGWQACVRNSLESLFPSVAADFDEDKNGFEPSEITACSSKKVWWRNASCGSWKDYTDKSIRPYTR